jgi:hypothetical protein
MSSNPHGKPGRNAQKIVDVLSAPGVEYIFGVPGPAPPGKRGAAFL